AAAHAPRAGHRRHLPVPAELERVPVRPDVHHRGSHAHAAHGHLRVALERVLRQLSDPGRLARALLAARAGALLRLPAGVHRGADRRRAETLTARYHGRAMALERDGVDVQDPWQAIEVCYERGWTDGLPVV